MIQPPCNECIYKNCPKIPATPISQNDLMIIGIGPGDDELRKKVPFVGPSGRLLKESILHSGLPVNPFITNALLCKPPKDKQVNKQAIQCCRARVFNEIEQVKPKMIIAFGNVPVASITENHSLKISTIHSKPMHFKDILLIPLFHPAAVLRNMKNVQAFKDGMKYAGELFNGGELKNPGVTEYLVVDSDELAVKAVNFLSKFEILFTDIETGGLDPYRCPILCIGFSYAKNRVIIFPDTFMKHIRPLLSSNIKLCWQRGQFDTYFLRTNSFEANIDHDTQLLHYCLDESEGGHDLKTLAIRFLGADDYEKEVIKYKKKDRGYADCPRPLLYKYLAFDCDYEGQLFDIFLPKVESDPDLNWLYYHILLPGINMLRRTTQNGFYIDKVYTLLYKKKLENEIKALEAEIISQIGILWNREEYLKDTEAKSAPKLLNLKSTQQMAWILYDKIGIKPTIDADDRCIDEKILNNVSYAHPFIPVFIQFKKKCKTLSTYVNGVLNNLGPDGRVRTTFSLQTTVTGRLSSSNPNLQNIDRKPEVKNIFSAPSGRILIEADYKGVELRLLQYFSKDKALEEIFINNRDPHNEMSEKIFGPNFTKDQRVAVKGLNFGIPYGRGYKSIAEEFNLPERDAKEMIIDWLNAVPQSKAYLENCEKMFLNREMFVTPFGRKRRWGIVLNDMNLKNEAKNFTIQSTASDLTFISAMILEEPLKKLNSMIVNLVHDSIIIEAPNERNIFNQVVDLICQVMENVPKDTLHPTIPFPAELKVGKSWGSMFEIDTRTKEVIYEEE